MIASSLPSPARPLAILFLALTLTLATAPTRGESAEAPPSPTLVTVAGAITQSNRGPLDPFRDALMARLIDPFEAAYAFDAAALAALPQGEMTVAYPEWEGREHSFSGPLVAALLATVGAEGVSIAVMGLDGYYAVFERAVLEKAGFILATHMDGAPLEVGGLGPTWLMVSPEIEPAFSDGVPSEDGLVWSAFFLLVE